MVFQCEIEFKAVRFIVLKFGFKMGKINELLLNHKELSHMLNEITLESISNLTKADIHLQNLHEAMEFCMNNDL